MKVTGFLSGLKRCRYIVPLSFGLLFLTACGMGEQSGFTLTDAEQAGLIMPRTHFEDASGDSIFEIVQVGMQDITSGTTFLAPIVFPSERNLSFQATEGEISFYVELGQRVRQGDVLARLTFDLNIRLEMDYFAIRQQIYLLEENFEQELSRRRAQINAAGNEEADEYTRRQARLALQLLELDLERFILNHNISRDALENQAAALHNFINGEEITAPFDGIVTYLTLYPVDLRSNPVIATVADENIFFFQITLGDGHPLLRYYNIIRRGDIITLHSGDDLEFDAVIVTDSWASGQRAQFIYWLKPADMQGFNETMRQISPGDAPNLHSIFYFAPRANVDVIVAQDALVLQANAVHSENPLTYAVFTYNYYVFIYNEGRPSKRYVQTGIRSGGLVQIVSGLEVGDRVVIMQ